jgi:hypothetical protein
MGGKGSGGRRPGTGPKPKKRHLHLVDGTSGHRQAPEATAPVEPFDPPPALALFGDDLLMWEYLSPLAFKKRTLTTETALAFGLLCRNIVREQKMAVSALHAGGADHRGLIQRIDAELLSFDLRPNGKAIYEAEEPANGVPTNPLARFGFGAR